MDSSLKVLTRAKHGLISGSLSGLADYYGLSRGKLQFLFLLFFFFGFGVVLYIILWVSIPSYEQRETLLAAKAQKQANE